MRVSDDLVGQTLLNRYRVEAHVGQGGMADVYKTYDARRGTALALKVLRPDLAHDARLYERFAQEAHLLQALNHPHIVRVYGWHDTPGLIFMIMQYVDGSNLRAVIQKHGRPFNPAEALRYFRPVTSALHYAHQKSVFHCDVKPSNILLDREGGVYVSDFGVARLRAGVGALGTPTHMAPEQFEGGTVDARTDIYALGVVLYELATGGNRPFKGSSWSSPGTTVGERIGWEHVHQPPPPPRVFNASISPGLEAVILRALRKHPAERFGSTLEMLEALEATAREDVRSTRGAPAYLRERGGERFPIEGDLCLLGRSREAQMRFSSPRVSRRHALVHRWQGQSYIQDLGSRTGTYVNGRRVMTQVLRSGDVIQLGDVEVEFQEAQ